MYSNILYLLFLPRLERLEPPLELAGAHEVLGGDAVVLL